jgi:hypothetical protein
MFSFSVYLSHGLPDIDEDVAEDKFTEEYRQIHDSLSLIIRLLLELSETLIPQRIYSMIINLSMSTAYCAPSSAPN